MTHELQLPLSRLVLAEQFLVWACRYWAAEQRSPGAGMPRLRQAFTVAGTEDAVLPFHLLMSVLAAHHNRPVDLRCPGCPQLGRDEALLLQAIGSCQRCCYSLAATLLQECLPFDAARQAADHADRLGRLLAEAGLVLPVRQLAGAAPYPDRGLSLLQ